MISKTEMLGAFEKVSHRITEVLYEWAQKEANNLEDFINNPTGHVNYNPYIVPDYSALEYRLSALRQAEKDLRTITDFKIGSPDVTRTQHDVAIENIPVQLTLRLEVWMNKRISDMKEVVNQGSSQSYNAPIDDYASLYTFNTSKFMDELNMYTSSQEGISVVNQYKNERLEDTSTSTVELFSDPTTEA
jgi:hypothetical protein